MGDSEVRFLDGVTVSFEVERFTAIMGPSGSGKSTLMHCLAGLDTLTSGAVYVGDTYLARLNDKELTELRRAKVGFVFQAYNLIPTLTARENILLPLMLGGDDGDQAWIDQVVGTVGLADRMKHRPSELSGGQSSARRGRALAGKPEIIFADEPTGNLDSHSSHEILDFMRRGPRVRPDDRHGHPRSGRGVVRRPGDLPHRRKDRRRDDRTDCRTRARQDEGVGPVSQRAIALIARRSIRARLGRLIAIAIAILVGVSFVVGAFVLADSLRKTFDDLFTQISENVDLEVRVGRLRRGRHRPAPRPHPGVGRRAGRSSRRCGCHRARTAALRPADRPGRQGRRHAGRTDAGRRLERRRVAVRPADQGRGTPRQAPTRWPSTSRPPIREDFAVGDTIEVITDTGTFPFTITALVGLGDSDGFAGATLAAWDVATAQQVTGAIDQFDAVDVAVDESADPAEVQRASRRCCPLARR